MNEQPNFEELLLSISGRFVNLPVHAIDNAIEAAQRQICEYLALDLSALWQWSINTPNLLTITHIHRPLDVPEPSKNIDASETFPWLYNKVLLDEAQAFSTKDLPPEASIDKATRNYFGVTSSVLVPIKISSDEIVGAISFDTVGKERPWTPKEVRQLKLITEIFGYALARKKVTEELIQSNRRLALAAESAETGLWDLNYQTNTFWMTDQACKILGLDPKDIVTMHEFEQCVFENDLPKIRETISKSIKNNQSFKIEYRIKGPAGQVKWILSKGKAHYDEAGEPNCLLGLSLDISEKKQLEADLAQQILEAEETKHKIEQENYYLRKDLKSEKGFEHLIGESQQFKNILELVHQVAPTPATALLLGETGTGKSVIAHTIHKLSDRQKHPFVTVNCAALPYNLIESELFGRERGAFTGAEKRQLGRFEIADKGTIFLDEIGEMPLDMQTKLLRVLQEGEFERLGNPKSIKTTVRVLAATSRNLQEDVENGRFREDLFYRLNVFPITIPPLRQRIDDIVLFAHHFTDLYAKKMGKTIDSIAKSSIDSMLNYSWPGNIRELQHLIERSVIISSGTTLNLCNTCFPDKDKNDEDSNYTDLANNEREHILRVLQHTKWKIEGPKGAAKILNINPSTLRFRLKKLGVKRPSLNI